MVLAIINVAIWQQAIAGKRRKRLSYSLPRVTLSHLLSILLKRKEVEDAKEKQVVA